MNIPPNIATRANTRGPFLFQCCRVVLNKETNRLELPKGEVVGKTVRSKEEEKEAENENTAVSLVEDKESNLMGKISICFPLNHSGILEPTPSLELCLSFHESDSIYITLHSS